MWTLTASAAAGGCADASLYRRFHRAGLTQLTLFPYLVPVTKADPRFTLFQQQFLAGLDPGEAAEWRSAMAEAEADGTFFMAQPFHPRSIRIYHRTQRRDHVDKKRRATMLTTAAGHCRCDYVLSRLLASRRSGVCNPSVNER